MRPSLPSLGAGAACWYRSSFFIAACSYSGRATQPGPFAVIVPRDARI